MDIKAFADERNQIFSDFVVTDDLSNVYLFCQIYHIPIPADEAVLKAGVYKAVQECTDIPEDIKAMAREKCMALGFKPTMWG